MRSTMAPAGLLATWLACVVFDAARAAEPPRPGSWKLTTKTERDGVVRSERLAVSCLKAEEIKEPEMGIADKPTALHGTCKRTSLQKSGSGLSWNIECQGKATFSAKTSIVFDTADHFSGVTQVALSSPLSKFTMAATKRIEAQRIGECQQ